MLIGADVSEPERTGSVAVAAVTAVVGVADDTDDVADNADDILGLALFLEGWFDLFVHLFVCLGP